MNMEISFLKKLIEIVESSDIEEIELRGSGCRETGAREGAGSARSGGR
jgi:hypothetical protein